MLQARSYQGGPVDPVKKMLRRESLTAVTAAAQMAYDLAQDQYNADLVDFSNVLDAQLSLQSFQDELAQSDGAVISNLVRLYKAFGGGWKYMEPATDKSNAA